MILPTFFYFHFSKILRGTHSFGHFFADKSVQCPTWSPGPSIPSIPRRVVSKKVWHLSGFQVRASLEGLGWGPNPAMTSLPSWGGWKWMASHGGKLNQSEPKKTCFLKIAKQNSYENSKRWRFGFLGGFGWTQLWFGKFLKVIGEIITDFKRYLIEKPHETDDFGDFVDLWSWNMMQLKLPFQGCSFLLPKDLRMATGSTFDFPGPDE